MIAAIIVIMLIAGGGTSYAAEGAVPGDFLYPVKIEVNENIKSVLAISNEAEARLQVQLAEERLVEAETLAERGKLTAEASADISSRLKVHTNEAGKRSATAEADGDYESSATVRASLEGGFRVHANVLEDLNKRVSGNNGAELITDVRTYADATAKAQTHATATIEASVGMQKAVEATINRADKFIAKAEIRLAQVESKVSAEAYARVKAKLNEAVFAQAEAKASLQTKDYRTAYASAQSVIRIASEVETMINSMLRLKIDVELSTSTVIDDVLDDQTEPNDDKTQIESNTRTNAESNTETTDKSDSGPSIDVKVDATTDTTVGTDVIDARVKTNTSIKSNPGLNL